MERAVAHLNAKGIAAPDHLLAHTSPLGWSHISLTGDCLWEQAGATQHSTRPDHRVDTGDQLNGTVKSVCPGASSDNLDICSRNVDASSLRWTDRA
jgi:hypothetical protein